MISKRCYTGILVLFFSLVLCSSSVFSQALNLTMIASDRVAAPADTITYELSLSNQDVVDLNNLRAEIQLPTYINDFDSDGVLSCGNDCKAEEVVFWDAGSLVAGQKKRIQFHVQVNENAESGIIESSASMSLGTSTIYDTSYEIEILDLPDLKDCRENFHVVVENMPQLIGGLGSFQDELRYPAMALIAGIEGRVYVQFIVTKFGTPLDLRVIRGIRGGADEEALRLIKNIAKFNPGMQDNEVVCVQYSLPIVFRLSDEIPMITALSNSEIEINVNQTFEFETPVLVSDDYENIKFKVNGKSGSFLPIWLGYEVNDDRTLTFSGKPDETGIYPIEITAENESGHSSYTTIPLIVNDEFITSTEDKSTFSPKEFYLSQNFPNPFNPSTVIAFDLPYGTEVNLSVYNVVGQKVATLIDQTMTAGSHRVDFDASYLSSGVYLYKITAGNFVQTRKLSLIK